MDAEVRDKLLELIKLWPTATVDISCKTCRKARKRDEKQASYCRHRSDFNPIFNDQPCYYWLPTFDVVKIAVMAFDRRRQEALFGPKEVCGRELGVKSS